MEVLILSGILAGAFFFGAFALGYYFGSKDNETPKEEGVTVTPENKEFIEEMQKWRNFRGK